jgi:hypothetical protein
VLVTKLVCIRWNLVTWPLWTYTKLGSFASQVCKQLYNFIRFGHIHNLFWKHNVQHEEFKWALMWLMGHHFGIPGLPYRTFWLLRWLSGMQIVCMRCHIMFWSLTVSWASYFLYVSCIYHINDWITYFSYLYHKLHDINMYVCRFLCKKCHFVWF